MPIKKMKNKPLLSFFISRGAIIYTCSSGIYFIISLLVQNTKPLEPRQFVFLLLYSYIVSAGITIYKCESISRVARRFWHTVCIVGGFALFLALCQVTFKPLIIATAFLAVIYGIYAVIAEIKLSRTKQSSAAESSKKPKNEYRSIFSNPDSGKDNNK